MTSTFDLNPHHSNQFFLQSLGEWDGCAWELTDGPKTCASSRSSGQRAGTEAPSAKDTSTVGWLSREHPKQITYSSWSVQSKMSQGLRSAYLYLLTCGAAS